MDRDPRRAARGKRQWWFSKIGWASMNRYALVGLILNLVGTVGVGLIPYFGMAAGYGGPIVFRSALWAWAWALAWLVFIAGAVVSALMSR